MICEQEKKDRFEQEKMLMSLEEVVLVLWPVQGTKGWEVYADLAKERQNFLPAVGERAMYTADICITFEPYRQALLPPAEGSGLNAPPSPSRQSKGASKAHAAIKQTYANFNGE